MLLYVQSPAIILSSWLNVLYHGRVLETEVYMNANSLLNYTNTTCGYGCIVKTCVKCDWLWCSNWKAYLWIVSDSIRIRYNNLIDHNKGAQRPTMINTLLTDKFAVHKYIHDCRIYHRQHKQLSSVHRQLPLNDFALMSFQFPHVPYPWINRDKGSKLRAIVRTDCKDRL